jgi:hypothetical protein
MNRDERNGFIIIGMVVAIILVLALYGCVTGRWQSPPASEAALIVGR